MYLTGFVIALAASAITAALFRFRQGQSSGADRRHLVDLEQQLASCRDALASTQIVLEQTVNLRTEQLKTINQQLTQEIEERQELERALRISQQNYQSIVEDQPEMILRFKLDGTVTFANKAYCDRYHMTPEQCIGSNCFENIHPEYRQHVLEQIRSINLQNPTGSRVIKVSRPDGSQDWAEWGGRALYDVDGALVGFQGIGRIVTDLVETQERLKESELRYRSIVENQSEMIIHVDAHGQLTFANEAYLKYHKFTQEQALASKVTDIKDAGELAKVLKVIDSLTPDKPTDRVRIRLLRDGRTVWQDWYAIGLFDATGKFLCVQGVGRDVTSLVEAEEELHKKEELLRHASRLSLLGEMVAVITHELRQPLYSISNFAFACQHQLIAINAPGGEKVVGWNNEIIDQVQKANEIIQRLRGFARRGDTVACSVNINGVIQEAIALLQFELKQASVEVVEDFDPALPLALVDRLQIEQVLVNLIRNSCEALSTEGQTARRISVRTKSAGGWLEVSVEDNGPGLVETDIESVFQPFQTTKPEGLGLGLPICRSIILEHAGQISVENLHPGLAVRFKLPLIDAAS